MLKNYDTFVVLSALSFCVGKNSRVLETFINNLACLCLKEKKNPLQEFPTMFLTMSTKSLNNI